MRKAKPRYVDDQLDCLDCPFTDAVGKLKPEHIGKAPCKGEGMRCISKKEYAAVAAKVEGDHD